MASEFEIKGVTPNNNVFNLNFILETFSNCTILVIGKDLPHFTPELLLPVILLLTSVTRVIKFRGVVWKHRPLRKGWYCLTYLYFEHETIQAHFEMGERRDNAHFLNTSQNSENSIPPPPQLITNTYLSHFFGVKPNLFPKSNYQTFPSYHLVFLVDVVMPVWRKHLGVGSYLWSNIDINPFIVVLQKFEDHANQMVKLTIQTIHYICHFGCDLHQPRDVEPIPINHLDSVLFSILKHDLSLEKYFWKSYKQDSSVQDLGNIMDELKVKRIPSIGDTHRTFYIKTLSKSSFFEFLPIYLLRDEVQELDENKTSLYPTPRLLPEIHSGFTTPQYRTTFYAEFVDNFMFTSDTLMEKEYFNFITCDVNWKSSYDFYIKPFSFHVWLSVLISLLATSAMFLLATMRTSRPKKSVFNILLTFSCFLLELDIQPKIARRKSADWKTPQLIIVFWAIVSLILSNAYVGIFTSDLIKPFEPEMDTKFIENLIGWEIFSPIAKDTKEQLWYFLNPNNISRDIRDEYENNIEFWRLETKILLLLYYLHWQEEKFRELSPSLTNNKESSKLAQISKFVNSFFLQNNEDGISNAKLLKPLSYRYPSQFFSNMTKKDCHKIAYVDLVQNIDSILIYANSRYPRHMKFVKGKDKFEGVSYSFRTQASNDNLLAWRLSVMLSSGIYHFWENLFANYAANTKQLFQYYDERKDDVKSTVENDEAVALSLDSRVETAFLILIFGLVLSLSAIFVELLYLHCNNFHDKTKNKDKTIIFK
ncbi:hypothetical protein Fcan01_09872 [Folsomia candida]|uniref:Uncharacterized protein n=1 Tax=Folsomia candida TaxID=158441 RepID=A0A226EFT5_FOLCA|nr:hypothetical protein Fcan01_09872 [Folsomia candida]